MVLKQLNVYMEGGGRRRKGWGFRSEVGHFVPVNSFWVARECRRGERTGYIQYPKIHSKGS